MPAGETTGTLTSARPLRSRADIVRLVEGDGWMMEVLRAAQAANLPDWWIGAGFVRARVWDVLHGRSAPTELDDVDLIYFDAADLRPARERSVEAALAAMLQAPWSVKNQARMHLKNGDRPYGDSEDAMRHWLETATCIAASLDEDGRLRLLSPYGLSDLLGLRVCPTPSGRRRLEAYRGRLEAKNWSGRWPLLSVDCG